MAFTETQQAKIDALVEGVDELSEVPGWEGLRQNAAAGYYLDKPANNLALDIRGLSFETPEETAEAEALAVRAAGGEFTDQGGDEP